MATKPRTSYLPVPYRNTDGSSTGVQENLIRIQAKRQLKEGRKTALTEIAAEILAKAKG
jgi:hypothetical protein